MKDVSVVAAMDRLKPDSWIVSRRGGVLPFLALVLFVLIGVAALAVDVGRLYVARQRAQNVVDAAAVAGAWRLLFVGDLPPSSGVVQAVTASANRVGVANDSAAWPVQNLAVTVVSRRVRLDDGTYRPMYPAGNSLEVNCRVPVQYTFAQIFGLTNSWASAGAVAVRISTQKLKSRFVPWAVPYGAGDLQSRIGLLTTLKIAEPARRTGLGSSDLFCVDYPGSDYQIQIEGNGIEVAMDVQDYTKTYSLYPASMSLAQETLEGIANRISADSLTFDAWKSQGFPDTQRLVLMPVLQDPAGASATWLHGYAGFFIEGEPAMVDGEVQVTGYFVAPVVSGGVVRWSVDRCGTIDNLATSIELFR